MVPGPSGCFFMPTGPCVSGDFLGLKCVLWSRKYARVTLSLVIGWIGIILWNYQIISLLSSYVLLWYGAFQNISEYHRKVPLLFTFHKVSWMYKGGTGLLPSTCRLPRNFRKLRTILQSICQPNAEDATRSIEMSLWYVAWSWGCNANYVPK